MQCSSGDNASVILKWHGDSEGHGGDKNALGMRVLVRPSMPLGLCLSPTVKIRSKLKLVEFKSKA